MNIQEEKILVIQMHLLNVPIQWMTFIRIFTITTQARKKKLIVFDDMIAYNMSNEKFQSINK